MDPKGPEAKDRKESEETACPQEPKEGYKYQGWFLTYPQCPADAQSVLDDLKDSLANQKKPISILEYVICEEQHKDGSPHLHAFLKVDRRIHFKKNLFDIIFEGETYHGNYQVAKSYMAVKKYVMKGPKYITNLNLKNLETKSGPKKIGPKELEMDPLEALEKGIIGGLQLVNFVKNQNMYMLLKNKREAEKIKNFFDLPKKRHRWIYGPSNTGKTTGLRALIAMDPQNWFQIPPNNDWAGYKSQRYLYMDEYKGKLTIQELNTICDGGAKVNVKNSTTILRYDVTVYIISNYSIAECYSKADSGILDTLYNRFNEIECKTLEKLLAEVELIKKEFLPP